MSWDIYNELRMMSADELRCVQLIDDAWRTLDTQGMRTVELEWYLKGGYDSINPLLRARDAATRQLPGHRNDLWLRERVQRAVHEIDALPRITLDQNLTVWRARTDGRQHPRAGQIQRDRAFISVSVRRDVCEAMFEWDEYAARGTHRQFLYEITVPAGLAVIPAFSHYLHNVQSTYACAMILNEAEIILPRNMYLKIDSTVERKNQPTLVRATAVLGMQHAPSTDQLPASIGNLAAC